MKKLIFFISLLIIAYSSKSQIYVNFGADTTYACDSVFVHFHDSSIAVGGINKWFWDFGNNTTDTLKNPTCFYDTAGVYTVKLIVWSPTKTDSIIKTNYIIVRQKPIADFIIKPNPDYYLNDTLILASYYYYIADNSFEDSLTYKYKWDFNTGVFIDSTQKLVYRFSKAGNFNIGMIINANYGCVDTVYKSIDVTDDLIVPTVFTPNGDGVNDVFYIRTNGNTYYTIEIYSRYGTIVYKYTAKEIYWDGRTSAGKEVEDGTYYYVISSENGQSKAGYFLLNR